MEEKKNIEVVSGDGSNLDISPVYDHLNASVPQSATKINNTIEKKKSCNFKIATFFLFIILTFLIFN